MSASATVSVHRPAFPCAASTRSWAQGPPHGLGLTENDLGRIYDILDDLNRAAAAEKARYSRPAAVPQNRAQRRAEKRQKDKKHKPPVSYPGQPVSRSEGFYPQAVPAAQMVERVDKAARRKQLLDELAALENG